MEAARGGYGLTSLPAQFTPARLSGLRDATKGRMYRIRDAGSRLSGL
jgi:hypothetical protein